MTDIGPGDVVVCVDASGCPELIEGARYRVEGFCRELSHPHQFPYGIQLAGIDPGFCWCSYRPTRFRPINDGDSAIFREMIQTREPVA